MTETAASQSEQRKLYMDFAVDLIRDLLKVVASFDGQLHIRRAHQVLAQDTHLAKCCVGVFDLIRVVDKFALQFLVPAILSGIDSELKHALAHFESLIYGGGEFRKFALSHLFNFASSEHLIELDGLKIARMHSVAIARALGDPSNTPFTHHPGRVT